MKNRKQKKDNKTERIEIRVTEEEKEQLKNKAEYLNMTVSQLLLKTALSSKKINIVPSINGKLFVELCKQGNNLNQLSRNLNQTALNQKIPLLNRHGLQILEELEKTSNLILNILNNQHKQ